MTLPADVFVVAAVRTAIGSFGGMLRDTPLADLATVPAGPRSNAAACRRPRSASR